MTQDIEKAAIWPTELGGSTWEKLAPTDNGIVTVTTHLYDGKKSWPLELEIYQPASSLPQGKEDQEFKKKPEIAIDLIERSLKRGYRPKIVLIDAGYGNNTNFLKALEERKLKYLVGLKQISSPKIA